jgi:hypothetical protein
MLAGFDRLVLPWAAVQVFFIYAFKISPPNSGRFRTDFSHILQTCLRSGGQVPTRREVDQRLGPHSTRKRYNLCEPARRSLFGRGK